MGIECVMLTQMVNLVVASWAQLVNGCCQRELVILFLIYFHKVDMAAAFVPNILEFQQLVSFSVPIEEESWVMILKRPTESAVGEGLLAPFTDFVWFLIIAAVVIFGPCVFILTHIRAKLMPDDIPPFSLFHCVWFVYGSLLKQGTNLRPKANTTRVLFTTWWMFVMLLSAFYMANLTAFLTLSQFTLEVNSPLDLMKKNYPWIAPSGGLVEFAVTKPTGNMHYLNQMVKKRRGQFQHYTEINDFFRKVDSGVVLIKSSTTAINGLYQNYVKKTKQGVPEKKRCTYVVAPRPFTKNMRGFIYPKNSILKTLFDSVIGVIIQSGIVEELKKLNVPNVKVCPMDLQTKERKLQITDLVMTYQIALGGLGVACMVFIGEIILNKHVTRNTKNNQIKNNNRSKRNKITAYSQSDVDNPPSYDTIFGNISKMIPTKDVHKKVVNGREYLVVDFQGGIRLIPLKTTSALLYKLGKVSTHVNARQCQNQQRS
ncbi:glutamate receptor 4-like isoform X2 [Plodia interpunctella]|uniref:glutamate receptor 4-like isoform X2 n=1 Tax=Plodia interpunctella TaxID=58824 RepID=UPI0023686EAC|nr:glutamate receptor 4-like isoform X2 [Plodia interpunctella]